MDHSLLGWRRVRNIQGVVGLLLFICHFMRSFTSLYYIIGAYQYKLRYTDYTRLLPGRGGMPGGPEDPLIRNDWDFLGSEGSMVSTGPSFLIHPVEDT